MTKDRKPRRSGPTIPESQRSRKQVTVRLSPEELANIDAVARERGLTRSDAVVTLAREELAKEALRKSGADDDRQEG